MAGLNKFGDKRKREQRRRNHIARDLRTKKYRKQVIEKKDDKWDGSWDESEE